MMSRQRCIEEKMGEVKMTLQSLAHQMQQSRTIRISKEIGHKHQQSYHMSEKSVGELTR
jgi:hypothetical protein